MRIGMRIAARLALVVGLMIGIDQRSANINILGVGGQSNGVGFANATALRNLDQYYRDPYASVLLRQQDFTNANPPVITSYATVSVRPRTNSPTLNMGVHLSAARYLNRRTSGGWAMSSMGGGSTGLADHWMNPAYPVGGPSLFNQFVKWNQDSERLLGGRLRVMFWAQGEQDATDVADAAAYEANLTAFINNLRLIWPGLPFVIMKLHINNPGSQKNVVRAAQVAVAAALPGITLLDVDALALQGDNLHFTPDAYITFGNMVGVAANVAIGISNLLPDWEPTYKGRTIDTTDFSTSDGSTVTTWDWDWGDGTAHSTTQNASHTYTEDTPRTITLTVGNAAGASKKLAKSVKPILRTWTVDEASERACPANATEHNALVAAHMPTWGAINHIIGCQEILNQTDSVGGKTMTAGGAPGTQQAFAGHTRLAVGHSGLATNQTFNNGTMPNIDVTPVYSMEYQRFTQSAAIRQLTFYGAAEGNAFTSVANTAQARIRTGASVAVSTLNWATRNMPVILVRNPTAGALQLNALISDIEVIKIPHVASAGTEFRHTVGASVDLTADHQVAYTQIQTGAAAQHTILEYLDYLRAHGHMVHIPGYPDL